MKRILMICCAILAGLAVAAAHATAAPVPQFDDIGSGTYAFLGAGLLVNKENLTNLFTVLKTTFNNAFGTAESNWEKYAMKVVSTTKQNDYAWLSKFPRMRKWIGDKVVKALEGFKYTIVNDDYEATVEVDRNDIEDDNLGIYGPQAMAAGESSKQLPDEIMSEVVNLSFVTACFDGQYFFDVDHPVRNADGSMGSVSNKGTNALRCDTLKAAQDSLGAAATAMMMFKDDEGRPLAVKPNVLMVPPSLESVADVLMTADRLEDGKPNPYKGKYEVVVNLRLTSSTAWFLLDTKKPIKPFIYQVRKEPVFVSQTDLNAPDVFNKKQFKFGAEARAAGGYGFWQLAFGSTGTANPLV